jgi:hypothetical protein
MNFLRRSESSNGPDWVAPVAPPPSLPRIRALSEVAAEYAQRSSDLEAELHRALAQLQGAEKRAEVAERHVALLEGHIEKLERDKDFFQDGWMTVRANFSMISAAILHAMAPKPEAPEVLAVQEEAGLAAVNEAVNAAPVEGDKC